MMSFEILCILLVLMIVAALIAVETGVNLFLILIGYRAGGEPPILNKGTDISLSAANSVDPLPQALVLTSIVIGLGVLGLMAAIAIRLYDRYGTFDINQMRRLRG